MKNRYITRILAIAAATALITSLAGCGSSSTTSTADTAGTSTDTTAASASGKTDDDTLNVVDSEWYGIDSYQLDSSAGLQQNVGESLFEWDTEKNDIVDGVCTDWKVSDDGKTATFNVPEGMYYSTGEQVEPEDVVASIQHGQEVSPYGDSYSNIESMDVDGRQVTLHLSGYRSDMLYALTGDFMCIIDKDELDSMSDDDLMWGCHPYGMYSLEDYVSGSEVKLKRNDKYITHSPLVQNQGAAHFAAMDITFNVEDFTALESLKNGEVDFLTSISNDSRSDLEGNDAVTVAEDSYPEIDYIELNTTSGPLQDINLRTAVAKLIDRDSLCGMTEGQAVPAYSMIYDSMQNFSQEAKDYFQQNYCNDQDGAFKLIEDAGYSKNGDGYYEKDGEVLTLDYYDSTGSVASIMGEGLQGQFQEYGIQVNLNQIDWNYVHEQVKSDDYDMAREGLGWAEPILILNRCYYDTDAPSKTEAYDQEVDDIASTVDSQERTDKITKIQEEMDQNLDVIPFYSTVSWLAYNSGLQGVNIRSDGSYSWNDITWGK